MSGEVSPTRLHRFRFAEDSLRGAIRALVESPPSSSSSSPATSNRREPADRYTSSTAFGRETKEGTTTISLVESEGESREKRAETVPACVPSVLEHREKRVVAAKNACACVHTCAYTHDICTHTYARVYTRDARARAPYIDDVNKRAKWSEREGQKEHEAATATTTTTIAADRRRCARLRSCAGGRSRGHGESKGEREDPARDETMPP